MSVQEIEVAITKLSSAEIQELSDWITEYRNQQWDRQLEEDVESGRLDALLDEADNEYQKGLTTPL